MSNKYYEYCPQVSFEESKLFFFVNNYCNPISKDIDFIETISSVLYKTIKIPDHINCVIQYIILITKEIFKVKWSICSHSFI